MLGETNISKLVKGLTPELNKGEYVFCSLKEIDIIRREDTLFEFKEKEGTTVVLLKSRAEALKLSYTFVASWITLKIHSSLEAVGLTAIFSAELTKHNISCNVVAGYYHDHIFVDVKDSEKTIKVLKMLSKKHK